MRQRLTIWRQTGLGMMKPEKKGKCWLKQLMTL